MFSKILIASDGSPLSAKAASAAIAVASACGAEVVALSVALLNPVMPEAGGLPDLSAYEDATRAEALQFIEPIAADAAKKNVHCELVVRYAPSPWREIIDVAEKHGCDCIWMASHGRHGLSRLLLGSETQRVLAHSVIPVMVYR